MESNNCFFISSFKINVSPFYYLLHLSTSIKKKFTTVPNLKQKCLSKLIFFASLEAKKITSSAVIFSFSHFSFKVLSINSFVSGNVLLTAFKTAKAIINRFLSTLTTRACSLIFYFSALCFKKYLKLFYTHSRYMIPNMERWLVFKISKYSHKTLWLVFKISRYGHVSGYEYLKYSRLSYKRRLLIWTFKILINYS